MTLLFLLADPLVLPFPLNLKLGTYNSQLICEEGHPLPTGKWIYCFIRRILMQLKTIDLKKKLIHPSWHPKKSQTGSLGAVRVIGLLSQAGQLDFPRTNSSSDLLRVCQQGAL